MITAISRILALIFIAGVSAVLGSWAADREPPARVLARHIESPIVAPGDSVYIYYAVDRRRSCNSHIDRFLFDANKVRFTLPDEDYEASPGPFGPQEYRISIRVPITAAMGPARIVTAGSHVCNLMHYLWPVTTMSPPIEFTIGETQPHSPGN